MRVLFDEDIPARLKKRIKGHEVKTVYGMGWQGQPDVKNVLQAVKLGFQVLVTCDRRLPRQVKRQLGGRLLHIVVLGRDARSNRIEDLRGEMPRLQQKLDWLQQRRATRLANKKHFERGTQDSLRGERR